MHQMNLNLLVNYVNIKHENQAQQSVHCPGQIQEINHIYPRVAHGKSKCSQPHSQQKSDDRSGNPETPLASLDLAELAPIHGALLELRGSMRMCLAHQIRDDNQQLQLCSNQVRRLWSSKELVSNPSLVLGSLGKTAPWVEKV